MELARAARPDDRVVCMDLLARALESAATMRGGLALLGHADAESLFARWTAGTAPGTRCTTLLVGEFAGAVVGLAGVSVAETEIPDAPGDRGRCLIECCYVEEPARGVGVGTALLEAAVAWCEGQGCTEVDAVALPGDRATKQRLEAAGFTARLLTLSRPSS